MQATIEEILQRPAKYADQIVNIDGTLLVTAFDRSTSQFDQVWLVQANSAAPLGIQSLPISSESTLWHGLSRLSARHLPGYQNYRIHDAVRTCARVIAEADDAPFIDILTAAVYRPDFTLFVGESGVRLEQAVPNKATISAVPDIRTRKARYLKRECYVYGTLFIRAAPAAQFLLPGKIPTFAAVPRGAVAGQTEPVAAEWLADIVYPQSDSQWESAHPLQDSIQIDPYYPIAGRLAAFPGINQTTVKPAIIQGKPVDSRKEEHFAALTAVSNIYLQNIRIEGSAKFFESVIKLKNFAGGAG